MSSFQVSQELKKIRKKWSGAGTDEVYKSTWPYFNALKFLFPVLSANSTQSNMNVTQTQSTVSSIVASEPSNLVSETNF